MKRIVFFVLLALGLTAACKKEKNYIYRVNDVPVKPEGADKSRVKTTTEFISIVYSDLFGKTITNKELTDLAQAYSSFGDKKLIEDMIVRNFLNKPGVIVPEKKEMQAGPEGFISGTFKKFYNREPNAFEQWSLVNMIKNDTSIVPELVYYAILTSNEYRYY